MTFMTPPPARTFDVTAIYLSGGEPFAREHFSIDLTSNAAPYAAARLRAEDSQYAHPLIPGLTIFVWLRERSPDDPDPRPPTAGAAPDVGCYLVLSTHHVRNTTAEQLDTWAMQTTNGHPIRVARTDCGWFVGTRGDALTRADELPDELPLILAFGRAHGCAHVLLDCDGPEEVQLPRFAW